MSSLATLPNEVVFDIIVHLPPLSKLALYNTSHRFRLLQEPLTTDDEDAVLAAIANDTAPLWRGVDGYADDVAEHPYRTCWPCSRRLPFFHFVRVSRGAAPRQQPRVRCVGCWTAYFDAMGTTARARLARLRRSERWIMGQQARLCRHCGQLMAVFDKCTMQWCGSSACSHMERGVEHTSTADAARARSCRYARINTRYTDIDRVDYVKVFAAKAEQVAPEKLEFLVSRLAERLDRILEGLEPAVQMAELDTIRRLERMALDGGIDAGVDPVGDYIRDAEQRLHA